MVVVTRRAQKSLEHAPRHIAVNFIIWKREVDLHGIDATRKVVGYHDEPLKGKLRGMRSVRLGLGYRAYYRIDETRGHMLIVEEVNKHDYKAVERLLGR